MSTNKSRRERQASKQEKQIVIGGVVGLTALLALGWFALDWAERNTPAPTTALEGADLSQRWTAVVEATQGGHQSFVHMGGGSADAPDVIFVGTSDCSACSSFVSNNLPAVVEEAVARDWSVLYAGIGLGGQARNAAALTSCLRGGVVETDLTGEQVVVVSYDLSARTARGQDPVPVLREQGMNEEVVACFEEALGDMTVWSNALLRGFSVGATPSFYVREGAASRVRVIQGNSPSEMLVRHVDEILSTR